MQLGDRLRALREKKGLKQTEFAERMRIPNQNVSNYERGFRQPDYETLKKFADFFEVSTDFLLGRAQTSDDRTDNIERDIRDPQTNLMFDGWLEMTEDQRQEALDFMEFLKSKKNKGRN